MARILLVRHSITTGEPGDPGLSPEGCELARRASGRFAGCEIRHIVTSPLRRSRETASVFAAALGLPVEIDDRLRERDNWGNVDGETRASFVDRWTRCDRDRDYVPEHGRSARQAGADLAAFVRDVSSRAADRETILAVAHGGVIVDFLLNTHTEDQLAARNPGYRHMANCALTEIRSCARSYTLERLAATLA